MESTTAKMEKQQFSSPSTVTNNEENLEQASSLKTQGSTTQPQETSLNTTTTPSQISIQQKLADQTIFITELTQQLDHEKNALYIVTLQTHSEIQRLEREIQMLKGEIQKLEVANKDITEMKESITTKVHEVDQEKQELQMKCKTLETQLQQQKEENITLKAILTQRENEDEEPKVKEAKEFSSQSHIASSSSLLYPVLKEPQPVEAPTLLQDPEVTKALENKLKDNNSL